MPFILFIVFFFLICSNGAFADDLPQDSSSQSSVLTSQLDGVFKRYYDSGEIGSEETYKNGKLNGPSKKYYKNGNLMHEDFYKDGVVDGVSRDYYENGQLRLEMHFKDGEVDKSTWKSYDEKGNLLVENGRQRSPKPSQDGGR